MTSDKHMGTARELALSSEGIYRTAEFEALARDIAAALANAEREGMKRAAEIARDELVEIYEDSPDADVECNNLIRRISSTILSETGDGE